MHIRHILQICRGAILASEEHQNLLRKPQILLQLCGASLLCLFFVLQEVEELVFLEHELHDGARFVHELLQLVLLVHFEFKSIKKLECAKIG